MAKNLVINATQMANFGELHGGIPWPKREHDLVKGRKYNAGHSRGRVQVRTTLSDGTVFTFWKKAPRRKASKRKGGMY